jgi:PAS domain S-box-containing protein
MANDAVFVKTANGKISYWNKGAERLYGWTVNEARGHSPTDLLHPEYPEPLSEIESRDTWEGEITHTKQMAVALSLRVAGRPCEIRAGMLSVGWKSTQT